MTFKTFLSDINNVALAMESLKNITQFNTGSTIANGQALSDVAIKQYKTSIDGLNLSQAQAALSATALNDVQKQQILTSAGLLKNTQAVTLEEVKQMASSITLSAQKKEEILATLQGAYSEGQWNTKRLESIASGKGEVATIAQTILAKKSENAENVKNIAGRKALTASLKEELAARIALMASNPITWIIGITAISVGLVALQEKFSKSLKECTKDLKKYNSEFESAQSSVKSLSTELDTCQTRLAELQELANNGTISIVEQEEYEKLKKTNDELERNLKIEREKEQLNAMGGVKTANETVNKTVHSYYVRGDKDSYEGVVLHNELLDVTPKEELEAAIAEYNRLQEEIDKLNKSYDNSSISSEDYTTKLNGLTKAQTTARTRASEMSDILIECEQSYNNLENTGGKFTTTSKQNYDSVKLANQEYVSFLDIVNGVNNSLNNRQSYQDTINRFKSSEESSLNELTTKYQEIIDKRKELYSGENYVGNVDINNRPVVINDDGSYSTTSTAFQEKWVGDEESGHYIIAHFTPILPDGTVLDEDTLNDYIDRILNSDNPMEADKVENGGYGIVYKIDTEINGQEINDDNLEDAFGIADAWDVGMHNLQNEMYASEAEIKAQIERFDDDINSTDGSQKIKDFFDTEGINTTALIEEFNKVTEGINDADEAIQKWNEHKNNFSEVPLDLTSQLTESDNKLKEATLADLQSEADLLKTVKKEISENGRVGVSSLQKIIKEFPEAKEAVSEYMAGLISQEELFQKLEEVYNTDAEQYKKSATEKVKASSEFWNKMIEGNSYLQNALNDFYGDDYKNWTNLETAKAQSEKKLISQLGSLWAKYYENQLAAFMLIKNADGTVSVEDNTNNFQRKTVGNKLSGFNTLPGSNIDKVKEAGEKQTEADRAKLASLQKYIDAYNKAIKAMNDAANIPIDLDYTDWNALSGDDSSSSSSSQTAEKLNWIERLINKISTAYSHLKNVVSDTTTTWLNRNNALEDSMSTLRDEINAQSQAYEYYMNAFNSYDLDDYYKNQIADGSISIDVIYDDDLKDAISDCQDFYDKAQDCKDAVESLSQEYRELAMTKFNNIKSQFEEQISLIENTTSELQKMQDILSTQGYTNSKFLYGSLIKTEKENLEKLNAEYTALASKIGTVEEGSENWYSMQADINSVSEAILDATNSLREYENELRKIEWDAFDRGRDDVADLIDETEFLYNLLENKGLYDDSGNLNEYGQAAQAMTAQKYQLYASQAKAYADEINKINEELAKDPYNTTLIDRKQELIKLQQESIKSALDEKNAIKDLISNGFEEYTKSLNEIIDKYKDMMSTIKDAYDYEKSIAEQTKNIALLEKQYTAYQGDDSEGSKKTIQEIKANLESAKDDLKETEYEKLISDTEKLLDDLQDSTEEWLNQRLDDLDALIENVINQSNENAGSVSETIANVAKETGYTLSDNMNSIWSTYSGNLVNALGNASDVFTNNQSKLQSVVENIGDKVQKLLDYADAEAARLQAEQEAREEAAREEAARQEAADTDNSWSGSDYDGDSGDSSSGGSGGVDWIYSPDYYPKDQLNIETSIVDRLKWHDWDSSFSARSQYYDQMGGDGNYYATYDQNVWMLDWMKANGFAKGSRNIPKNQIALTQEKGQELIFSKLKGTMLTPLGKGDMVFTKEMSENLWKLAQNPIAPNMSVPDVKNVVNRNLSNNVKVEFGDVAVTLPNVQNYQDFCRQAQKDPKFEKMVQNMALGQAFGKNGFDKYVY